MPGAIGGGDWQMFGLRVIGSGTGTDRCWFMGHRVWDREALKTGLSHLLCTQGRCPI